MSARAHRIKSRRSYLDVSAGVGVAEQLEASTSAPSSANHSAVRPPPATDANQVVREGHYEAELVQAQVRVVLWCGVWRTCAWTAGL